LLEIQRKEPTGWKVIEGVEEAPFYWRYSNELTRDLGEADCDLFYITKKEKLRLRKMPNTGKDAFRPPIELILTLEAPAPDARSPRIYVNVNWDGGWPEDGETHNTHIVVGQREIVEQHWLARLSAILERCSR
jgi:hypothetical protein